MYNKSISIKRIVSRSSARLQLINHGSMANRKTKFIFELSYIKNSLLSKVCGCDESIWFFVGMIVSNGLLYKWQLLVSTHTKFLMTAGLGYKCDKTSEAFGGRLLTDLVRRGANTHTESSVWVESDSILQCCLITKWGWKSEHIMDVRYVTISSREKHA